jgi:hypothetical protein
MKKILSAFAVLAFVASQTPFAQAMPVETSARSLDKQPARVFMPDAVGILNQLTMTTEFGGVGFDAALDPVQDTTPPTITFVPPSLALFPPQPIGGFGGFADGNIISVSFDTDAPFIVAVGAGSAVGNGFNVGVINFATFFDLVNIQLPTGAIEVGIGFIAAAQFEGLYDFFTPVCPCGALDVAAVDFAGNVSNGTALVVVVSF